MVPIHQPLGIDHCNCFTVRKAARQISRFCDAHLQPTGLRITQFLILATFERSEERRGERTRRTPRHRTAATGKMLGFLERDSLVKIQPSPTDGRSRIIELTHQGQALFETAEPLWREAQRQFEQMNGTENARALRAG